MIRSIEVFIHKLKLCLDTDILSRYALLQCNGGVLVYILDLELNNEIVFFPKRRSSRYRQVDGKPEPTSSSLLLLKTKSNDATLDPQ
jgi:hypothetical protein